MERRKKKKRSGKTYVKQLLFQEFGYFCMLCGLRYDKHFLQLHHIVKFEHSRTTVYEDCGILCCCCHTNLHYNERKDKKEYDRLNNKIREYKNKRA